jgi:tetratricopeptide (TPR) repeat protein
VLKEHPDLLELYRLLGELAVAEENWPRAFVEYELYLHLLEASPGGGAPGLRASARNAMGVARLERGQHDAALVDFEVAISLDPGDSNSLRSAAVALVALERLEEAAEQLGAALELDPGNEEMARVRARLLAGDASDFR